MEKRSYQTEFQTEGNRVTGTAIVFNTPTTIHGERSKPFTEVVRQGSLNIAPNCRLLWAHDPSNVLGNLASGTLKLREDSQGLHFDCQLPESALRERESLARGDVNAMSFGFNITKDKWTDNTRELLGIDVMEISIVAFPAYPNTKANLRSNALMRLELAEKEII